MKTAITPIRGFLVTIVRAIPFRTSNAKEWVKKTQKHCVFQPFVIPLNSRSRPSRWVYNNI